MLTAAAIMTEDLVTIHPEASIKDAIELLLNKRSAACRSSTTRATWWA